MKKLLLSALAVLLTSPTLFAEGPPSNWPFRSWPSDGFGWFNGNKWKKSTTKSGTDDFRNENIRIVGLGGGNKGLEVVMKSENNNANDFTGGWAESKAAYWRVGWWEARLKLDWTRDNVWPTWWMITQRPTTGNSDELDIMEFSTESLGMSHWKAVFQNGTRTNKYKVGTKYPGYNIPGRFWNAWHSGVNSTPAWEHNWAMARCRSWTNWAAKVENNKNTIMFINGKREFIGGKVWNPMKFIFSGSPQLGRLPARGTNLPNMKVDWINAYHP